MTERPLLRIGEFARIGRVSIATLHHYEKSSLLKPDALDPDTGYRYYSLHQLTHLNRILALKELGFPLKQISQLLEEELSLEQLRGMFTIKQAQAQQIINTEQARLTRIAYRLQQIEQGGIMPAYEVLLKQVDPLLIASIRATIQMGDDLEQPYRTLIAYLDQQHAQYSHPAMRLLYSRYEWHGNNMAIDVEAAVPLLTALPNNERIRMLSGGLMACTIHLGGDLFLGQAHGALSRWVKDNGYQIIGLPRYVHLQRAEHIALSQYVTEVQFPVEERKNHEEAY